MGTWEPRHAVTRDHAGDLGGRAAFTRDGKMLAIVHSRTLVKLIESATGQELAALEAGHQEPLCFSPDGSQLVVSREDGTLQVWDLRSVRRQLAAIGLDW